MIFEQFYLGCLAHASYLIGSEGEAVIVDPQRDVDIYIDAAREHGLRITHILETHLHADFVSGHMELAKRTGADIYLGAGSGAKFPHVEANEGDQISAGKCRLKILSTPGHTGESICVVVTDTERSEQPYAVLTGDTMFIGEVGRPDLSETHTPAELAALLYDSLYDKLLKLPDDVLVYPAHGAGSMCGRNISSERFSTMGKQRKENYALQAKSCEEFVAMVTAELPARPAYFLRDVEMNRSGAATLSELQPIPALSSDEVAALQSAGALVLDTRSAGEFGASHVPSALNIGLGGQFASWAGSIIGLDKDIILVCADDENASEARMRLARVGIERTVGFLQGGMEAWSAAGKKVGRTPQLTPVELSKEMQRGGALIILDVRNPGEWRDGHIDGAQHHALNSLEHSLTELDPEGNYAVHCKGGYRSSIACSILQARGFRSVVNLAGGFDAWLAAGFPKTEETQTVAAH